jgi:hypothetical protein
MYREEVLHRSRSRSHERPPRYRSRSHERRLPIIKRYPDTSFQRNEDQYMPRYYERDREEYSRRSPERYQRIVINRTTESYSRETRRYDYPDDGRYYREPE